MILPLRLQCGRLCDQAICCRHKGTIPTSKEREHRADEHGGHRQDIKIANKHNEHVHQRKTADVQTKDKSLPPLIGQSAQGYRNDEI